MTFRKLLQLFLFLMIVSGILHAQDMERWLWVRPGRENTILKEPMVGKTPSGLVHRFFFEGRGKKLEKFCTEFLEDLSIQKENEKRKSESLNEIPPTTTEIEDLQEKLLQAAIVASLAGVTQSASSGPEAINYP